jgi:hypothetical protein
VNAEGDILAPVRAILFQAEEGAIDAYGVAARAAVLELSSTWKNALIDDPEFPITAMLDDICDVIRCLEQVRDRTSSAAKASATHVEALDLREGRRTMVDDHHA